MLKAGLVNPLEGEDGRQNERIRRTVVRYLVLAYVHIYPRKVKLLTSFTQNLVPGSIAEVEKINQGYKELLDSNLPLSGSN